MPLKALQYDGVRERWLNARFQTAVNLNVDFNRNFVLKLSSLEYNARSDPKDCHQVVMRRKKFTGSSTPHHGLSKMLFNSDARSVCGS